LEVFAKNDPKICLTWREPHFGHGGRRVPWAETVSTRVNRLRHLPHS
jgi:hypothetical protein